MILKILGTVLIIASSAGFGFLLAVNHRSNIRGIYTLLNILDFMECELNYRLTALPQLCGQVSADHKNPIGILFGDLGHRLESIASPDVEQCMNLSLQKHPDIPDAVKPMLEALGKTLGRFDLNGQVQGIGAVRKSCRSALETLEKNKDDRIRGYKTLSLCAGLALAVLLI